MCYDQLCPDWKKNSLAFGSVDRSQWWALTPIFPPFSQSLSSVGEATPSGLMDKRVLKTDRVLSNQGSRSAHRAWAGFICSTPKSSPVRNLPFSPSQVVQVAACVQNPSITKLPYDDIQNQSPRISEIVFLHPFFYYFTSLFPPLEASLYSCPSL